MTNQVFFKNGKKLKFYLYNFGEKETKKYCELIKSNGGAFAESVVRDGFNVSGSPSIPRDLYGQWYSPELIEVACGTKVLPNIIDYRIREHVVDVNNPDETKKHFWDTMEDEESIVRKDERTVTTPTPIVVLPEPLGIKIVASTNGTNSRIIKRPRASESTKGPENKKIKVSNELLSEDEVQGREFDRAKEVTEEKKEFEGEKGNEKDNEKVKHFIETAATDKMKTEKGKRPNYKTKEKKDFRARVLELREKKVPFTKIFPQLASSMRFGINKDKQKTHDDLRVMWYTRIRNRNKDQSESESESEE